MDGLQLILAKRGKGWQAIANRRKAGLCQGGWAALRLLLAAAALASCHLSNILSFILQKGCASYFKTARQGARNWSVSAIKQC